MISFNHKARKAMANQYLTPKQYEKAHHIRAHLCWINGLIALGVCFGKVWLGVVYWLLSYVGWNILGVWTRYNRERALIDEANKRFLRIKQIDAQIHWALQQQDVSKAEELFKERDEIQRSASVVLENIKEGL